jgi:hypothetical protein
MKEIYGNLWDKKFDKPRFWRCITTNGVVRKDGKAVMGRGCARDAAERFSDLPFQLGYRLSKYGNQLEPFPSYRIVTFPVKYDWREKANLSLIELSARQLKEVAILNPDIIYILPKPGCGNGQLEWENVKKVIEPILPDNVWIIDFEKKE